MNDRLSVQKTPATNLHPAWSHQSLLSIHSLPTKPSPVDKQKRSSNKHSWRPSAKNKNKPGLGEAVYVVHEDSLTETGSETDLCETVNGMKSTTYRPLSDKVTSNGPKCGRGRSKSRRATRPSTGIDPDKFPIETTFSSNGAVHTKRDSTVSVTLIGPRHSLKSLGLDWKPLTPQLKRISESRSLDDVAEFRVLLRTFFIMAMGSFVICVLGASLLNLIFSRVAYPQRSSKPRQFDEGAGDNFLILAAIYATASSVLSVIGTIFINLFVACVNHGIERSRSPEMTSG